jgi:ribose transport system permease protein
MEGRFPLPSKQPVTARTLGNVGLVIAVGAIACLVTGVLYGLINGLIIAVVGINSLIATLATLGIGTGIADLITGGTDLQGLPSQLQTAIGLRTFGAVPLVSIIALAALVILWLFVPPGTGCACRQSDRRARPSHGS